MKLMGAVEGVSVGEAGVGAAVDVTLGTTVCDLVGAGDREFGGITVDTWVRAAVGGGVWVRVGANV